MRADEFDAAICQPFTQWIAVGGAIVNQAIRNVIGDGFVEQRFDQADFGWAGTVDINCQWQAVALDEQHDLGAFATFGGTYEITPFFAEANVPSAKPSSHSMSPR